MGGGKATGKLFDKMIYGYVKEMRSKGGTIGPKVSSFEFLKFLTSKEVIEFDVKNNPLIID